MQFAALLLNTPETTRDSCHRSSLVLVLFWPIALSTSASRGLAILVFVRPAKRLGLGVKMTIHVQQRSFLGRAKSMPAASKLGVPSNFLQASTTHKPTPLKPIAIPDKRASSVTSYPSPEVSPDCTTSNHTCASAMESAIASRNSRETMERPIDSPNIHATPQRTSPPPDRDSSRADELNSASNVGKGCPVAGCQKKDFSFLGEFMQHLRDFHASEFKCSRPDCTFYEIKLLSKNRICRHCLKKHPHLLSARNRLRAELQPSSQSELSREIKQHHNREVLQGTELPPPPPPKSLSPRNSTSPNSDKYDLFTLVAAHTHTYTNFFQVL
jgi:hypothetical protein